MQYYRYGSDITVTLPANGKFSAKQRAIYEGVLNTMNTVRNKMKPGVLMPDMHILADKCVALLPGTTGLTEISDAAAVTLSRRDMWVAEFVWGSNLQRPP